MYANVSNSNFSSLSSLSSGSSLSIGSSCSSFSSGLTSNNLYTIVMYRLEALNAPIYNINHLSFLCRQY